MHYATVPLAYLLMRSVHLLRAKGRLERFSSCAAARFDIDVGSGQIPIDFLDCFVEPAAPRASESVSAATSCRIPAQRLFAVFVSVPERIVHVYIQRFGFVGVDVGTCD